MNFQSSVGVEKPALQPVDGAAVLLFRTPRTHGALGLFEWGYRVSRRRGWREVFIEKFRLFIRSPAISTSNHLQHDVAPFQRHGNHVARLDLDGGLGNALAVDGDLAAGDERLGERARFGDTREEKPLVDALARGNEWLVSGMRERPYFFI